MGILFFRRCRMDRRKLRVLILMNALAILSGTLMPEKYIEQITDGLTHSISTMVSEPSETNGLKVDKPEQSNHQVDLFNAAVGSLHKTGHFLLFASLCFLVYISATLEKQGGFYFIKVGFDLLLFATITESLQYLTVDRTPGITDWLTDVYGMLAALVLFTPIYFIWSRVTRVR